jgi:hypothetical protein
VNEEILAAEPGLADEPAEEGLLDGDLLAAVGADPDVVAVGDE